MEKRKRGQLNNKGVTLVELVVTFALLALFLVAATNVIVYTTNIYYSAKGATYGLEVSNMISNKIIGQLEGARVSKNPEVNDINGRVQSISFIDESGSKVTILADEQKVDDDSKKIDGEFINIHYDEVTEGSVHYAAVDWRFDHKAYMGYTVTKLRFENPGSQYPENVVKMVLELSSNRYGSYETVYYIKCSNVEKITYK